MCAAGGGKTTRIVSDALHDANSRSLLVTYTRNNEREIARKFFEREAVIPAHVEVMTWFTFLLRELARPYRRVLHNRRIDNLMFVEGKSVALVPATNVAAHYFAEGRYIYSDKI
jgi:DNA helicase-2/ATP-dependent DNA helicase PcrA